MILIKNGTVLPMSAPQIENGAVLIEGKKIKKVGAERELIAALTENEIDGLTVIDAEGGWIMPGLIDAHCHVGIVEDSNGIDGCNEAFAPVTPYISALDGINPRDPAFRDAVRAGVTTVMVGPGSANVVGGQFIAMKTHGTVIDDMALLAPAAMKVAFGENPMRNYKNLSVMPSTRMAIAGMLREELFNAVHYKRDKDEAAAAGKPFKEDFRSECWLPVLRREIPLKMHVHRADDIMTAVRIAKEFGLDATLDHCTEGFIVADRLAQAGFPAIVGPIETFRNKIEVAALDFANAGRLHAAGVKVAICTDHPVCIVRSLPLCAGLAVAQGLPLAEGLRAVTVNAAAICRIADRVGSLRPGLDADVAVYTGNPMETFTKTLYTLIDGEIVYCCEK